MPCEVHADSAVPLPLSLPPSSVSRYPVPFRGLLGWSLSTAVSLFLLLAFWPEHPHPTGVYRTFSTRRCRNRGGLSNREIKSESWNRWNGNIHRTEVCELVISCPKQMNWSCPLDRPSRLAVLDLCQGGWYRSACRRPQTHPV